MISRSIPDLKIRFANVNCLSVGQRRDWDIIVDLSQEATVYHTIEWNDLQRRYIGIENRTAFAYWEGNPVGLFSIFRRTKNRFMSHICNAPLETPYGGPVTISDIPKEVKMEVIRQLVKNLIETCGGMTFSFNTILDFDLSSIQNFGFEIVKEMSSCLDMSAGDIGIYNGMRRNHKRQLKKAKSSEYKLILDNKFQFINKYYELLKVTYSRLGNKHLVDKEFYDMCCNKLPRGWVRLFMVKSKDEFIAGGLILIYKNSVIFWRGASLEEYMKLGANNFLYWSIIQWSIKNGYQILDTLHNPSDSLRHFKEGFGCKPRPSYFIQNISRKWALLQKFKNSFNN